MLFFYLILVDEHEKADYLKRINAQAEKINKLGVKDACRSVG